MTKRYKIGEIVFIRAMRHEGGASTVNSAHPLWDSYPVWTCVVAQVDVGGMEGCYGLEWSDTREPVGLPFFANQFCNGDGIPME